MTAIPDHIVFEVRNTAAGLDAVTGIAEAKAEAIEAIGTETTASVSTVNAAAAAGVTSIGNALASALSTFGTAVTDALALIAAQVSAASGYAAAALISAGTATDKAAEASASADLATLEQFNDQAGTAYTLGLAAARYKKTRMTAATANVVTIASDTGNPALDFPIGAIQPVQQRGAGQTSFVAAGGVTLHAPDGAKIRLQHKTIYLEKEAANEWTLQGDLTL